MKNYSYKERLRCQVKEEYGRLLYTYTCHLKMSKLLARKQSAFKWVQIVLSALTTGGFIGSIGCSGLIFEVAGAFLSALLLIVNTYLKQTNFAADAYARKQSADELWAVKEQYISFLTDFDELGLDDIKKQRDHLLGKTFEIYKLQLDVNKKAYKMAQRALKNEEEQYFGDEELDKMLPSCLRKGNGGDDG